MANNQKKTTQQTQNTQPSAEEQIKETPAPAEVTEIEKAPKKAKKPSFMSKAWKQNFAENHPKLTKVLGVSWKITKTVGTVAATGAVAGGVTYALNKKFGGIEAPTADDFDHAGDAAEGVTFGDAE